MAWNRNNKMSMDDVQAADVYKVPSTDEIMSIAEEARLNKILAEANQDAISDLGGNVDTSNNVRNFNQCHTTGTANNYTLDVAPQDSLQDGQWFLVDFHAINTGASTVSVPGISGNKPLKFNGDALSGGELTKAVITYNQSANVFEVFVVQAQNPGIDISSITGAPSGHISLGRVEMSTGQFATFTLRWKNVTQTVTAAADGALYRAYIPMGNWNAPFDVVISAWPACNNWKFFPSLNGYTNTSAGDINIRRSQNFVGDTASVTSFAIGLNYI